jgi:molecular chaperone IbpA
MTQLVRFDTTALAHLNRALIGFDRIFDEFENKANASSNYPPHNILRIAENQYEIQLAAAGFSKEELSVEVEQGHLVIRGIKAVSADPEPEFLHRGLALRDFDKIFPLAEHIEVGDVNLTNGLLCVKLTRVVPETLKARSIEIKG